MTSSSSISTLVASGKSKKLKFSGKITKMGDNRVIWIPKRLHKDIEEYEDEQLIIAIELTRI